MTSLSFTGRDFLTLADFTAAELTYLLDTADKLKAAPLATRSLSGKNLALLFEKPSMRTRVSFEVGMNQLGGSAILLSPDQTQLGKRESIADVARVLSRYADGIMVRTFAHSIALELAEYADVPVINGLTDLLHPCQVLADLMTIREYKGRLAGVKLAYFGDGNNMANSLLLGGAIMGLAVTIATPVTCQPPAEIMAQAQQLAAQSGGSVQVIDDPAEAACGVDVMYTDVWASMGQEAEAETKKSALQAYQLNDNLVRLAAPDCLIMHCLPAHYGEEITAEVAQGPQSVIYDQAENRLHAQKAVLHELLG